MKQTVFKSNRPAASAAGKLRQHVRAQPNQRRAVAGDSPTGVSPQMALPGANRKPLVLLVEDNLPVAEMALLLIRRLGVEAAHADNGWEGLRQARELVPDAIVTDVNLPGMSGLDLCRQLKADAPTSGIPILVWSGNPNHRPGALATGAVEFLVKPGEVLRLAECLSRMLGL